VTATDRRTDRRNYDSQDRDSSRGKNGSPHAIKPLSVSLFVCLVTLVHVLWPKGWMYQDATWYGGIGLVAGHIVFDRDHAAPGKGAQQPPNGNFRPYLLLWPNDFMDQDGPWYGGMSPPRPHCVRWVSSYPHMLRPNGWITECINMAPGTGVGLGLGRIVSDDIQLPPLKGTQLASITNRLLDPYILWPNDWMHQDAMHLVRR